MSLLGPRYLLIDRDRSAEQIASGGVAIAEGNAHPARRRRRGVRALSSITVDDMLEEQIHNGSHALWPVAKGQRWVNWREARESGALVLVRHPECWRTGEVLVPSVKELRRVHRDRVTFHRRGIKCQRA